MNLDYPGEPSVTTACVCACVLNHVHLFVTPQAVTQEAPLSMGFSRQESWSELLFPPPQDLSDPGMEHTTPVSPALQADSFPLWWETITEKGSTTDFLMRGYSKKFIEDVLARVSVRNQD